MARNKKQVSIITPTYNSEKYIIGTIESVVAQTYVDWEMLIVDDCSSDSTIDLVKSYIEEHHESRIRLFVNEQNEGAAFSRNRAIREARGRWIAFLDSDDFWKPMKLERQLAFMQDNGYAFSATEYVELNCHSGRVDKYVSAPDVINEYWMKKYCWIGCLTVMYDADIVGLVQIDPVLRNGSNDYPMWLGIVKKTACHTLKECLSIYRRREGSISNLNYPTLIRNIYVMYMTTYHSSIPKTLWLTFNALLFGVLKKMVFVKKMNYLEEKEISMYMDNMSRGGRLGSSNFLALGIVGIPS